MTRRSNKEIDLAKHRVCSIDESLHSSANDFGVEALALILHKSPTSLSNNLDPNQPDRRPTLSQFETIARETQDERILDSVHSLFPGTGWFALVDSELDGLELLQVFTGISTKTSKAVENIIHSLEDDGVIDDSEWPQLDYDLRRFMGAAQGLVSFVEKRRVKRCLQ